MVLPSFKKDIISLGMCIIGLKLRLIQLGKFNNSHYTRYLNSYLEVNLPYFGGELPINVQSAGELLELNVCTISSFYF